MPALALMGLLTSENADDVASGLNYLAASAHGELRRKAWQRAARAFFQSATNGRPPIIDADLLAEVRMLLECGKAKSLHAALTKVSRRAAGMAPSGAIYERLRRKWKLKHGAPPGGIQTRRGYGSGPAPSLQTDKAEIGDKTTIMKAAANASIPKSG